MASSGTIRIPSVTGDIVIIAVAKTLGRITAVFEQGSHKVYQSDSLDSLRPYLAVTAHYYDGTSGTIQDYTLSGTLAMGTCTITVSYGGKTATFSVYVSAPAISTYYTVEKSGTIMTITLNGDEEDMTASINSSTLTETVHS
jgi:Bacterial Ig-like domain (group 3).